MPFSIRSVLPLLFVAGLAGAACATAQVPADIGTQLAQLGGATHALGAKCGHYTDAELQQLKKQQRAQHQASGLDMASFDATFEQAHREAETRWSGATETQRRDTCAKIAP